MPPVPELEWILLAPVKRLEQAKSRLSTRPAAQRRSLALAFALDSVRAMAAATRVREVVVVTDDEQVRGALTAVDVRWLPDGPEPGLNPAVAHAADVVRAEHPGVGIAVVAADLPALRSDEVDRALLAAAATPRGFVADAAGTGTTLLSVRPGALLDPRFGPRSRAAHAASGAVPLSPPAVPGLRRDVDTEVDLWDAGRLGLGSATAAVVGASSHG